MASQLHFLLPSTTGGFVALVLGVLILSVYATLRWIRPCPIPGIPYNEAATKSILGDFPALLKHARETGEMMSWIPTQITKLDSPIIQLFMRPFSKPWVIIADFRESQDILLRRTKEFDRSTNFRDLVSGITPDHHIIMSSSNPEFKIHRRLIQDLMTPAFLHDVSAPRIYAAISSLVQLWTEKTRLAQNHPFSASEDFYCAALDAIWAVVFPFQVEDGVVNARRELLASLKSLENGFPSHLDEAVEFPEVAVPAAQQSIFTLTDSLEITAKLPFPRLSHWFIRRLPYMRRARTAKEEMIRDALEQGKQRFMQSGKHGFKARCALDDILSRELAAAAKENRQPVYDTRAIYDELFGLLIAGHDTTSTTVAWGLKFLSSNQDVQEKVRCAMREGFPAALTEGRWPTAEEIAKAHIPYLDATQEEIIRNSQTAPGVIREAKVDTMVLGHVVPKGTWVVLLGNGPDLMSPPVRDIPERLRSESSRTAKGRVRSWDPVDIHMFKPERWLVKEEDGNDVFDSTAGPLLTFGLGPRGCFGRRMAYLEMKISLVLLLWNFRLKEVPEELNTWAAVDKLTHQPKQCYVRLERI